MPTIAHKDFVGTNELSSATGLTISDYVHPGGALTVFGYHQGGPSSGYSVTFDGEAIPVLEVATGLGSFDAWPSTFLAHADGVPAATGDLVISWDDSRSRPSCHVFSVDGQRHAHALNRQANTTSLSVNVDSEAEQFVLCYVGWRNSADNISGRGAGQASELTDDSPTRQSTDSKAGASSSTSFAFTMSSTEAPAAYNLHAISYVDAGQEIEETAEEEISFAAEDGHDINFTTPGEEISFSVLVEDTVIVEETVAESPAVDIATGHEVEFTTPGESVGVGVTVTDDVGAAPVEETVAESVGIELDGGLEIEWDAPEESVAVSEVVTDTVSGAPIEESVTEAVGIGVEVWSDVADSDLTDPLTIDGTSVLVWQDGWDYTSEDLAVTERTATGALASGRTDTRGRVRVWTVTTPPLDRADARTLRDDLRTSGTRQASGYLIGGLTEVRITGVIVTPVEGLYAEVRWTMRESVPVEWGALASS